MENTRLLSDSKEDLIIAANLIKSGKVVGIPTETVYGLGADAINSQAVKAVFAAKGRPADNPLIVHICSMRTVRILAHDVPKLFYSLAERFWPGPLTMIVAKNNMVPYETSGGLDTVAIRMPAQSGHEKSDSAYRTYRCSFGKYFRLSKSYNCGACVKGYERKNSSYNRRRKLFFWG